MLWTLILSVLANLHFAFEAKVFGLKSDLWIVVPLFVFYASLATRIRTKTAWDLGLGNVSSLLELGVALWCLVAMLLDKLLLSDVRNEEAELLGTEASPR